MGGRGSSFGSTETWQDFESLSDSETDSAFQQNYDEWRQQLTDDEYDSVQEYTGGLYEELNEYLRTGAIPEYVSEETLKHYAENIQSAMNKASFPFNLVVHRWSGSHLLHQLVPGLWNMTPQQQAKELNNYIGSVVTDKGVTSTSTQHIRSFGTVRYDIQINKGTSAQYVRPLSNVKHEMEVATNIGTSYVLKGASVVDGGLKVDLGIYREGRKGREKQVRNVGVRGNK